MIGLDFIEDEYLRIVNMINDLIDEIECSRAELGKKSGFNKSKVLRIINNLIDKNIKQKMGSGPGTTYKLR